MASVLLENLLSVSQSAPSKVLITDAEQDISARELVDAIKIVGAQLSAKYPVESRALLVIENSINYVVALYGCWFAGLIAVPVDANARGREIARVAAHAEPSVVITTAKKRKAAIEGAPSVPLLDIDEIRRGPSVASDTTYRDDVELAQILYTSGTSGNPKGVVLSHTNLASNTVAIVKYLNLAADDSALAVLPFHYSYGNSVLHTHLYVGARLIVGESMMYPQKVVEKLRDFGVTGFSGVPTTFAFVLSKTDLAQDPPPLRYVTQAGGAMSKSLTETLMASLHPKTSLFVMYGQTEATARLCWLPPDRLPEKLGSVGIPVQGVQLRIVSDEGDDAAVGQVGEVLATGPNIMSGYWKNPAASDSVVVNGCLHTGDLGFLDEDGFLFLVGRASEMIKSGAHRISPSEIEEVVQELDFVEDVAVCGMPDELLGEVPAAFVIGQESVENTLLVQSHCRKALSLHKVPKRIIWKREFPRTSSGKIKKRILAEELSANT